MKDLINTRRHGPVGQQNGDLSFPDDEPTIRPTRCLKRMRSPIGKGQRPALLLNPTAGIKHYPAYRWLRWDSGLDISKLSVKTLPRPTGRSLQRFPALSSRRPFLRAVQTDRHCGN